MREVKPTQKPVPSSDIKDLFFNSGLLDIWATSLERKYIDRFGNCHLTAAGMEYIFNELVEKFEVDVNAAIVSAGYIPIDSFQHGAQLPNNELTQRNQIIRDEITGEYYRWDGDLPKKVPAGSTPHTTGGVGVGRWLLVSRDVSGLVNVVDFGAIADCQKNDPASGTDSTQAFKRAISAARSTNSVLYVPPCRTGFGYRIEDTLFFGPKKLSDVIPFPPINVCLGLVGGGDESTFLIPGVGLKDKVMLDFTGLGHKYAKDFAIWSLDESIAPSVGILTARFSRGGNAVTGNHGGVFSDVQMFKYFSVAGRLAITTEESYELRLNIRNDHKDSFGCFVSTSDGSSEAYKDSTSGVSHTWNNIIGEQPESELTRENVAGSNLHQVHVKCDYYYGNNTPNADKKPCMLRIDGANSMVIRDPFFNNNSYEYDCVQIRRAGTAGIPYGITIENPIYHQNLKSGVRVMTGLNRLVMTQSNNLPGFSFSEAELVIDGFLSGSDIRGVRSVKQNEPVVDTTFDYISGVYSQSNSVTSCTLSKVSTYTQVTSSAISGSNLMCNTMNWNTNSGITNSKVTVNSTLNASGARLGTPSFKLTYRGSEINISGQIPSSWLGSPSGISIDALVIAVGGNSTAHKLLGRSQSHSVQILEQENSSSTEAIQKKIAPSGTGQNFRYTEHIQGGVSVYEERKDGVHVFKSPSGGPAITAQNGNVYRIVVSGTGDLSTVRIS
ncbi:hypothetical protein [Providencia alcalifaciens]|uniref:tail fiber/spike domain-containing protein n=1 Tax=Providencia alcalifaciens TaxID=126385 RepID=UPI003D99AE4B